MPRLPTGSITGLILTGAICGAVGAGLVWLGIEERVDLLLSIGLGLAGTAVAALVFALARAGRQLFRRGRDAGARLSAEHRARLRLLLFGGSALVALALLLAAHNYLVWAAVERHCELALEAEDGSTAWRAYNRGLAAMENPLLVIPSDLFDLWGPNRCRSAAHRFPATTGEAAAGGASPAQSDRSAKAAGAGPG